MSHHFLICSCHFQPISSPLLVASTGPGHKGSLSSPGSHSCGSENGTVDPTWEARKCLLEQNVHAVVGGEGERGCMGNVATAWIIRGTTATERWAQIGPGRALQLLVC